MNSFRERFTSTTNGWNNSHNSRSFAGLVLVPDATFPSGPLEMISPDLWSDALNAKVLNTVATIQAFMKILREFNAPVLLLTPSIISSLRPPFHSVESTVVGALEGLAGSIQAELASLGVDVYHIKLGNFNCSNMGEMQALERDQGAEVMSWPSFDRAAYARNFLLEQGQSGGQSILTALKNRRRGSPLRKLNNAVFDSLARRNVWSLRRIGQGSILYPTVGALAPSRLISWMMGVRAAHSGNHQQGSPVRSESA